MSKILLKTQNRPLLWVYIVFNVAIYICLIKFGGINVDEITEISQLLLSKEGLAFILSPIIVGLFEGIFSNKIKEVLVFWKFINRLPGCYSFSKYAKEDARVDRKKLKQKYGKLPKEPDEENRLWYKIYKQCTDGVIEKSHKSFLLMRDLTTITMINILLILILSLFININNELLVKYVAILFIIYLLFRVVTKNYAERFVCNVLAKASL